MIALTSMIASPSRCAVLCGSAWAPRSSQHRQQQSAVPSSPRCPGAGPTAPSVDCRHGLDHM